MAVLKKFAVLPIKLRLTKTPLLTITRNQYDKSFEEYLEFIKPLAVKHLMPGPYPKTEEERCKAAAKYGMHPDEYKPIPDGWLGSGDYPDLPWEGVEARDAYYPWDFPALRQNYGEPWHIQTEIMGEDAYAFGVRTKYNYYKCTLISFSIFAGAFLLDYLSPMREHPVLEKQYPKEGTHYTFQPTV